MFDLKIGTPVHVYPAAGLRVLESPEIPGRFLPVEGVTVSWSEWFQSLLMSGAISLVDPRNTNSN